MKTLIFSITASLGLLANSAAAEQMLSVDGTEYPLSVLMADCQTKSDDPAEQIACFNNVSRLIVEQSEEEQVAAISVPEALEALRALAQYQSDDTGLSILGTDCRIQIVYYNNYFHISRRNISTIDLFSASFDASKLQYDQSVNVPGSQSPLSSGAMESGVSALVSGGMALESAQHGFEPKSSRLTIAEFAREVSGQLPSREGQQFEFVLVHPNQGNASAEIWGAFETFLNACKP